MSEQQSGIDDSATRHGDQLMREDGRWRIDVRRGFIDIPTNYPKGT